MVEGRELAERMFMVPGMVIYSLGPVDLVELMFMFSAKAEYVP